MAIYIGGKKVQETGGKYQPKGIPTKTKKRPKKQSGMDARSFAASGVEKRQRQFDKEKKFKDDQAAARRRMEENFRTGRNVQKSDFIPKDRPKLREGLTSEEYGDYMRNLYKLNPQMMRNVFPVASGAVAEKFLIPAPLRMVGQGLKSLFPSSKEDSENTVVSSTTEQELLEPRKDIQGIRYSQPSSAQLAFPGVMGIRRQQPPPAFPGILNALRNEPTVTPYESNQQFSFPGVMDRRRQQPPPSFVEDPRLGLGVEPEVIAFVEDPRLDINEVIEDKIDLAEVPEILYGLSKEDLDFPEATKNYIDEFMQTYGKGSAPFERAKEIDDRARQQYEETHNEPKYDYDPFTPGNQSIFDVFDGNTRDDYDSDSAFMRDIIMKRLRAGQDVNYENQSKFPPAFLKDKTGAFYPTDRDFTESFQDVDFRTGGIPAEAFSGARTALIPEAASIMPQFVPNDLPAFNEGGIASLYNNSDADMLTETNSYYGAF